MRRYLPLLPWALVALALVWLTLALRSDRRSQRDVGAWSAIAKRLQRDSAVAANTIRRVDSVFTRDTITYTRRRDVYRDRVDSIRIDVPFTVRETVLVAAADSAIAACTAVVTSCQARVAARDTLIRVLGEQRTADRRLFDARLRAAAPRVLPFIEAGTDPLHQWGLTARGGVELRVVGPLRLSAALDYSTAPTTHTRAMLGARWVF